MIRDPLLSRTSPDDLRWSLKLAEKWFIIYHEASLAQLLCCTCANNRPHTSLLPRSDKEIVTDERATSREDREEDCCVCGLDEEDFDHEGKACDEREGAQPLQ